LRAPIRVTMGRAPRRLCLFLALPLCAIGQPPQHTPPDIVVYTEFENPFSAVAVSEMKHEVETIMGPLGLEFTWRPLHGDRGYEVSAELMVVTLKGTCQMDRIIPGHGDAVGALGWTHMSDGVVLPFSELDCDKIRRFIAPELRLLDARKREFAFGRAMGRVLAHEFYHVFTNTAHHASGGLAKACYNPRDLVAERFRFEEKDTNALRRGKLKEI